jgi:hypothetical protein
MIGQTGQRVEFQGAPLALTGCRGRCCNKQIQVVHHTDGSKSSIIYIALSRDCSVLGGD